MKRLLIGALALSMAFTVPGMSQVVVLAQDEEPVSAENEIPHEEQGAQLELPPEYAAAITDSTGTYKYIVNEDGTATITDYLGTAEVTNLVVPSKLDGYGVSVIGEKSFEYIIGIDEITLSEGLVSIGRGAFGNSQGLDVVNVPASVTTISEAAFYTHGYVQINLASENINYKIANNALYTADGKLLLACWDKTGSYVIPDTVERIGDYAFFQNRYLVNLTIGNNVKTIGNSAFWYNLKLCNLVIPDSVEKVETSAFEHCEAIKTLKIGKSVTSIGFSCFEDAAIDELVIPSNVKCIEGRSFYSAGIKKITIQEGVESISSYAFACNEFETITFPASIQSISYGVVLNCDNLKEIKVTEGNQKYKIVDTALLTIDGKTIKAYPYGNGVENYEIPYGVITVGRECFKYCKLKRIEMPKTLRYIDMEAFDSCQTLEEIVIGGNVRNIAHRTFSFCSNLKSIYIPSSVVRIDSDSFWYCDSLKNIYYVGSEEQWNQIYISISGNKALEQATIHYMSNLRMFVERMYRDVLGRAYDNYGLNAWVQMLVEQTHDGAGLAKEFVLGQEFAMRNLSDEQFVDVLYATFFDRQADDTGKMLWLGELAAGKPRAYVLSKFVNLSEFTMVCDEYDIKQGVMFEDGNVATPGCVQFVERLYDLVMGRNADSEGLYNWTFALTYGIANAQSVATHFFSGEEYSAQNTSNAEYVTDLYGVFMDRTPDETGLAFWVSCLSEQGASREWVLSEFAKSTEFQMIAAGYGIQ